MHYRGHDPGEGPVCLVHSGGPGVHSEYLRMPGLEGGLTLVHLDPVGAGESEAGRSELRESGRSGRIEQRDEFAAIVSDFVNNQEMGKQA